MANLQPTLLSNNWSRIGSNYLTLSKNGQVDQTKQESQWIGVEVIFLHLKIYFLLSYGNKWDDKYDQKSFQSISKQITKYNQIWI